MSNNPNPQDMVNPPTIYLCKNCGEKISDKDKICPKCNADLSKVGRHISMSFSETIRISDYIKLSKKEREKIPIENVQWDSETLALFGIIISVLLGLIPFVVLALQVSIFYAFLISFLVTISILIIITRVRAVRVFLVKVSLWFLNKSKDDV